MEKIDTRYKNGKIYKLEKDGLIYIGSTIRNLKNRLSEHKCNGSSSKKLFETEGEVFITLLEDYPCNNKTELLRREGWYQRNIICINEEIAGRTRKEYTEDNIENVKIYREKNKEDRKIKDKIYREKNKEKYKITDARKYERNKIKLKEKITCECGSIIAKAQKTEHLKTIKHKNFVNSN